MKRFLFIAIMFLFVGSSYAGEEDIGNQEKELTKDSSEQKQEVLTGVNAMEVVQVVSVRNEHGQFLAITYQDESKQYVYCTNYIGSFTKQDSLRVNRILNSSSGGLPYLYFQKGNTTRKITQDDFNAKSAGGLPFRKI